MPQLRICADVEGDQERVNERRPTAAQKIVESSAGAGACSFEKTERREAADFGLKVAWKIVVFQRDAVL
jgi:hypothetical protein